MKNILISIVFLILAINANASSTVPGFLPTITIAGVTLPLSKAVILNAKTNNSTDYVTPNRSNVGYQVPAGKKLIVVGVQIAQSSSSPSSISIGYGDNATSSTVPTNAVYYLGTGGNMIFNVPGNSAYRSEFNLYFEVPSGKFLFVNGCATAFSNIVIIGYLAD